MGHTSPGTLPALNSAKILHWRSSMLMSEGLQDNTQEKVFNFGLIVFSLVLLW